MILQIDPFFLQLNFRFLDVRHLLLHFATLHSRM